MVNIFLTGATGYVGGQALYAITSAFPSSGVSVTCLIRDSKKAGQVLEKFPDIRVVPGDLEDTDVLTAESKVADIVLHLASTGHLESARAIAKGLGDPARANKPGYWIQMSGATLFAGAEIKAGIYGEATGSGPTLDDLSDSEKLLRIIKDSPNRVVDNLVISQSSEAIRTALVVGPLIYGSGQGPCNHRSIQTPEIARVTLEGGKGIRPGDGLSRWCNIHVHDLGNLFVQLVQAAIVGQSDVWNENGVYVPENGAMSFGELSALVAQEAHGQKLISSPNQDRILDKDEANKVTSHGAVLWGTNAVLTSSRARTKLGWLPTGPSLADTIGEVVSNEAQKQAIGTS